MHGEMVCNLCHLLWYKATYELQCVKNSYLVLNNNKEASYHLHNTDVLVDYFYTK
jgi:hypothetical protein